MSGPPVMYRVRVGSALQLLVDKRKLFHRTYVAPMVGDIVHVMWTGDDVSSYWEAVVKSMSDDGKYVIEYTGTYSGTQEIVDGSLLFRMIQATDVK